MTKKCKFFKSLCVVLLLVPTILSLYLNASAEVKSASEVGLPDATSDSFVARGYKQGNYTKPLDKYPDKTVAIMGCGFCTTSGIDLTISGTKRDPVAVANKYIKYYVHGSGCQHAVINGILSDWGYKIQPLGASKSELAEYLKKGYIVAMISSGPMFTRAGHFLYVYGYSKRTSYTTTKGAGKDKQGRPEKECARVFTSSLTYQNSQWFTLDTIVSDGNSGANAGGPFWAVVGYDGKVAQNNSSSDTAGGDASNVSGNASDVGYINFGGNVYNEEYFTEQGETWGYNLLSMAKSDMLTVNEQKQIARWSENIKNNSTGVVGLLRTATAFFGILVTIYSLLIYFCYWLDRSNNIVDIRTMKILTFNQLELSPDDTSSFNSKNNGIKYVTHRDVILIVIIGCTLGVLIITGQIYNIVGSFWHWTNSLIR